MILVTGSTGSLGGQIIGFLIKKGYPASQIAALARNENKAKDLKTHGIDIKIGNYDDYESLIKAFRGIEKILFISGSEIDKRDTQHENIINAAIETNIKHIIYTSFDRRSDSESTPIDYLTRIHIDTEKEIIKSGLTYTFLRNSIYAEFIPMYIGENVLESGIYIPAEDGKVPFASRTDMAEAAANVLMTEGHENKFYKTVNDRNYSFYDIAEILSDISGKNIEYTSPACTEYFNTLEKDGIPKDAICNAIGWISTFKQGYFESDTSDLGKLLGRKPTPLESILAGIYK